MKEKTSFASIRQQERTTRQELIVSAAERVFSEKPFDQVSIRDIAREAGISHASIYRYFPDRQALFVEAFLRGARTLLEMIRSGHESLGDLSETYLRFLIENDSYFRMMTHFMLDGSLKGEALEGLNAMERELLDELKTFFIKKHSGEKARKLSHAFFAAMNGILISFRNYPGRNRDEVVDHMLNLGRIIAARFMD